MQDKECYVCQTNYNMHEHHVFYGSGKRKLSEKYKMKVYLCGKHHNQSNEGVHFNKKLDFELKQAYQKKFELQHSHELFMKEFGKDYLNMTFEEYIKKGAA